MGDKRTEREHRAPPHALAQNCVNVGQKWTILECRQFLRANHALNEIVRFPLYVRVENHRKDEVHQHNGRLVLVNLGPNQRLLPAYRLIACCLRDDLVQPDKIILRNI